MITAAGIGSGFDVNGIVESLMEVERLPLMNLQQKNASLEAELSAYGRLRSALADLQDALSSLKNESTFNGRTAVSANETIFTATATSASNPGNYNIEVLQVAQNHKLSSTGFADASAVVGQGTLTISQGAGSFNVSIDATNNSLSGIRDAINNAVGNAGITASIINVDDGFGGTESRLVLTANEAGAANAISVAVNDSGDGNNLDAVGLSQLSHTGAALNLSQLSAAQDAQIKVDTLMISNTSNTFDAVIQGVTINVHTADPGTLYALKVGFNEQSTQQNIEDFADAFTTVRNTINALREGELAGDTTLLFLEQQMTGVFATPATGLAGGYTYLSEIGLSLQKSGALQVENVDLLTNALAGNPEGVAELFGDAVEGFATRLDSVIGGLLAQDGLIDARRDGLNDRIGRNEDRMESLQYRLERIEIRIRNQFTALDALISQMNSTSAFLSQQLAALPQAGALLGNSN